MRAQRRCARLADLLLLTRGVGLWQTKAAEEKHAAELEAGLAKLRAELESRVHDAEVRAMLMQRAATLLAPFSFARCALPLARLNPDGTPPCGSARAQDTAGAGLLAAGT